MPLTAISRRSRVALCKRQPNAHEHVRILCGTAGGHCRRPQTQSASHNKRCRQSSHHCSSKASPPRVDAAQQLVTRPDHQEYPRNDVQADTDEPRRVHGHPENRSGGESPEPKVRPLRDNDPTWVPITPEPIDKSHQHLSKDPHCEVGAKTHPEGPRCLSPVRMRRKRK